MGVMSVAYTTINGQIVSENRNGVPSDYIPDALGSTIALLSDTHQITDSWTYWPNGQVRTRTGTNPTPHTFCGTVGYHPDVESDSTYVQTRELRPGLARWQTVDPLWPSQAPYAYADSSPVSNTDPTGQFPLIIAAGAIVCPECLLLVGVGCAAAVVGYGAAKLGLAIGHSWRDHSTSSSEDECRNGKPKRKTYRLPPPPLLSEDATNSCHGWCDRNAGKRTAGLDRYWYGRWKACCIAWCDQASNNSREGLAKPAWDCDSNPPRAKWWTFAP